MRIMPSALSTIIPLLCLSTPSFAFSPQVRQTRLSSKLSMTLKSGDRVLLIGPSFLQCNIAKAAKAAGLRPMIVAPQKKIETFANWMNDSDIMSDADIGLPDEMGLVSGVVFCSEDAVLGPSLVTTVLDWGGYVGGGKPKKAVVCAPITRPVSKEKSMGWMPLINNDKEEATIWSKFTQAWKDHPVAQSSDGATIRFGGLLGGSCDGPDEIQALALDEQMYKMSLENYRDLRERSFDRYKLGAQILLGDTVNPKPNNQEKMEKNCLKGEPLEMFLCTGGYPEQDRTCRHTMAQAVIQTLMRPEHPDEFTVLSKGISSLPTQDEWDDMFVNPGPASWPDPVLFDPVSVGLDPSS